MMRSRGLTTLLKTDRDYPLIGIGLSIRTERAILRHFVLCLPCISSEMFDNHQQKANNYTQPIIS